MSEEQLRERIKWLADALVACRDHERREVLINRLLDTQDQLMFLGQAQPQFRGSPTSQRAAT